MSNFSTLSPWLILTPKRIIRVAVTLFAIVFGTWLLMQVEWGNLAASVRGQSASNLSLAVIATCLSFFGLAAYDVIAVRHLRLRAISNRRALTAGAVGYAVSNFVGFPWATGAIVRDVFYRQTGAGIGALMTVVLSSWVAFWSTAAALIGGVLVLRPDISTRAGIAPHGAGLGAVLLGGVVLVMIWLADGRQVFLWGQKFSLLARRVTLAQCGAALIDLTGSATVLYLFLPAHAASDVASFFALFVMAVGAGVLSHIPAGIGAFEGTILLGLQAADHRPITTALVMYRALRTLLPFLLACVVLAALALRRRNHAEPAA